MKKRTIFVLSIFAIGVVFSSVTESAAPPNVTVHPTHQVVRPGDDALITCTATGDEPIVIYWSTSNNEPSPRSAFVDKGALRFRGMKYVDAGTYVCHARNHFGSGESSAEVRVYNEPSSTATINNETTIEIEIVSSLNEKKEGDTLHLTCKVKGDASASTEWMKEDPGFENNVETMDNTLTITDMQISNAGLYRCLAKTKEGYKFMDYYLNISSDSTYTTKNPKPLRPTLSGSRYNHTLANVTKKSVKYGHNVDIVCDTNLHPPVNYSWIVHTYGNSFGKIAANTKTLTVTDATVSNSGIYFCKAVSSRGSFSLPTVLTVEHETVISAFSGSSYVALPSIVKNSAFVDRNDIEIHFRPKSDSGLILFNTLRNYRTLEYKDDFISFGLNGGFPEFKFEVGSDTTTIIQGDAPLQMNEWHKVVLSRNGRDGFMQINGIANFTGSSTGQYLEPNSIEPLFIGGHFDYVHISSLAKLNSGFEGCIGKLRIDSKEINLLKEAQSVKDVRGCDNCDPNPCQNDGFCQQTTSSLGYYCICRPGNGGENCQLRKDCKADSCGTGQCLENEDGIECY